MNIYWGDLHNHCGISYGFGRIEHAVRAARAQLDFCAVTGHAAWPDMPTRTAENAFMLDYHQAGFDKLHARWHAIRETIAAAHEPHRFVTFQGYEMHSRRHGDYHILSPDDNLPLIRDATSIHALTRRIGADRVLAIAHHPAYTSGYRGIDWKTFSTRTSPLVEIFSKHGCGLSDTSDYPYLHVMGPRDARSSAFAGLAAGHRFGFVASTDDHAGFPGSHGSGRVAVLAEALTREALWDALWQRRTYAVTGDKIQCDFTLNGVPMGGEYHGTETRRLRLAVIACDAIDTVRVFKNGMLWRTESAPFTAPHSAAQRYKIRVETGWGISPCDHEWQCAAEILDGRLVSVEPAFRGRGTLAPAPGMDPDDNFNAWNNRVEHQSPTHVAWACTTTPNPTPLHPSTGAVILELQGSPRTRLTLHVNGTRREWDLETLMAGTQTWHLQPTVSAAVQVHRAVPDWAWRQTFEWVDTERECVCDVYVAEVRQMNRQYAWLSPIFADSGVRHAPEKD